MGRLSGMVLGHKRAVVLLWLVLAGVGLATIGTTTGRLTASFALPGQTGYEINARIADLYHTGGADEPAVATITLPPGLTTTAPTTTAQIARMFAQAAHGPGPTRLLDRAVTGDRRFSAPDDRTAYALIFTPPTDAPGQTDLTPGIRTRLAAAAPAGWRTGVTGIPALTNGGGGGGTGLLLETLIGGVGALAVLAFVFASFVALVPLLMAAVAIPTTFLLVLGLTGVIHVSFVVQFLIALIGLGVAIDFSLLVVTRWRESRDLGADNDTAVREAMDTAGRSVILSGLTVAISLLALIVLPVPYLRSVGFAGFFVPITSIAVAVTLLPVLLATVGPWLDRPRLRHEAAASAPWTAWGRLTVRHRYVAAVVGVVIVAALATPFFALRTGEPASSALSRSGDAHSALTRLVAVGVPSGVISPIEVLARPDGATAAAKRIGAIPGVWLATAPTGAEFRRAGTAVIDVLPTDETSSPAGRATLRRIEAAAAHDPAIHGVGGSGAEDVDFGHAVYGNFPLLLTIIGLLTFVLLTRALRSLVLAAKAVVLNLASVASAYGVMVFVWQQGHGSNSLWGIPATGSITSWVPVVVFAFLFGLSMDYEVFILTRIREEYDATGSTDLAVITGIGRTGRLVTSAALILFLAFVSLASGPETNIKILATGLGAGILVDALVIRCLLVPSFVSIFGRWNWYLPGWIATLLRVPSVPLNPRQGVARPVPSQPLSPSSVD